jgi:signal peptidase I
MAKRVKSPATGDAPKRAVGRQDANEARPSVALEWLKSLGVAALIFIVLRSFLVQTFVITSGSMEDTLLVGDFLVVNRAAIGSPVPFTGLRIPGYSRARRGDVIVFDPPHEGREVGTPEMKLVKRLIGMPGDVVAMRDGVLSLNGEVVQEPYVKRTPIQDDPAPDCYPVREIRCWMSWQRDHVAPGVDTVSYVPTRDNWGPIVIPEDRYFMLGDNREASLDSRYWGLLEGRRLEGRAVFIYFSYNRDSVRPLKLFREIRWGRLGNLIRSRTTVE